MPITETLTPRDMRGRVPAEDALGLDRAVRAFLRTLPRLGAGALGQVQGAPGTGKAEFMRRCMHFIEEDRAALGETADELFPLTVWYNPWHYAKQGNLLAGLVASVARAGGTSTPQLIDRARDIVGQMTRMRFDGTVPEGAGPALNPGDPDPVDRMRRGMVLLVDAVKGGGMGRLVVFVADLDQLPAFVRMTFIDGLRVLMGGGADMVVVFALGREAALASIRAREGEGIPEAAAMRILDEMVDVAVTIPNIDIRRVASLLRKYIGTGETVVRKAFGEEAVNGLTVASAHRPLGIPRFLERLATRVLLLAEFAIETRSMRELSEAQWAWVILSERWPEFRRFMIRGGRERWMHLKAVVGGQQPDPRLGGNELLDWMRKDLILADYLRLHADGFERDIQGVYWAEDMMLQAGL